MPAHGRWFVDVHGNVDIVVYGDVYDVVGDIVFHVNRSILSDTFNDARRERFVVSALSLRLFAVVDILVTLTAVLGSDTHGNNR